jgi:hypothetical protein
VLPFALPAATVSVLGGVLALAAGAYWWALGTSAVVVGAGWLWVARQGIGTGRRPARATLTAMAVATLALGAAWSWSLVERHVIAAFKS